MNVIRSKRGFTLIEIMVVIAIISLLVLIAIPNLTRARVNANETSAKSCLRVISTACEMFRSAQAPPDYPPNLAALAATNPRYLDDELAGGQKQGYVFEYRYIDDLAFQAFARPRRQNVSGVSSFSIDQSGVLRDAATGQPLQ